MKLGPGRPRKTDRRWGVYTTEKSRVANEPAHEAKQEQKKQKYAEPPPKFSAEMPSVDQIKDSCMHGQLAEEVVGLPAPEKIYSSK